MEAFYTNRWKADSAITLHETSDSQCRAEQAGGYMYTFPGLKIKQAIILETRSQSCADQASTQNRGRGSRVTGPVPRAWSSKHTEIAGIKHENRPDYRPPQGLMPPLFPPDVGVASLAWAADRGAGRWMDDSGESWFSHVSKDARRECPVVIPSPSYHVGTEDALVNLPCFGELGEHRVSEEFPQPGPDGYGLKKGKIKHHPSKPTLTFGVGRAIYLWTFHLVSFSQCGEFLVIHDSKKGRPETLRVPPNFDAAASQIKRRRTPELCQPARKTKPLQSVECSDEATETGLSHHLPSMDGSRAMVKSTKTIVRKNVNPYSQVEIIQMNSSSNEQVTPISQVPTYIRATNFSVTVHTTVNNGQAICQ
ncbi:uncharacterized protein NECHADRAFT_79773 [Fusarium vanettenii 77-13-4]|uniref:Uncharacterized protein n=1 Tax=Fusarium vanettenii (strain ATCC MYA-4622 / CBS 123669 / FGSC 9596 / NRRL 45880 / 77-13-4) TaxID=660122 RepID=C7ZM25_FUSV7|nr:uncharacterized protein NECHADRAFT_79773 [Fusarium vanettenii 77-13-4]EEU34892.1 predicted protein [Fusarium vanettenii 77-13-4]